MNRVKAWLLRWLGAVSFDEITKLCAAVDKEIEVLRSERKAAFSNLKADYDATLAEQRTTIAELIQEVNDLRNRIPVAVTQDTHRPVRVLRNWRDFALEAGRKIPIERKA